MRHYYNLILLLLIITSCRPRIGDKEIESIYQSNYQDFEFLIDNVIKLPNDYYLIGIEKDSISIIQLEPEIKKYRLSIISGELSNHLENIIHIAKKLNIKNIIIRKIEIAICFKSRFFQKGCYELIFYKKKDFQKQNFEIKLDDNWYIRKIACEPG